MMDELNLDNMQGDSGITSKNIEVADEVVHSNTHLDDKEGNTTSLNQQHLDVTLKDPQRLDTDSINQENALDSNSNCVNTPAKVKLKPAVEMEEVIEFTEFGVPIRIMQVSILLCTLAILTTNLNGFECFRFSIISENNIMLNSLYHTNTLTKIYTLYQQYIVRMFAAQSNSSTIKTSYPSSTTTTKRR
jgi:hypothetical protein